MNKVISMKNTVSAKKNDTLVSYTYEELLNHHGGEMPGGVALAFRMLQWVFDEILQTIPEKGSCTFYSGLGENGKGIMDTVTEVLGVIPYESLHLDKSYSMDKTGPFAPGGGRYYFECGCHGELVKLAVKEGAIPEAFFDYSKEMHRKRTAGEKITKEEIEYLQQLRIDLSKAILSAKSSDLFLLLEK